MNLEELQGYDGRDGRKAYIAYNGKIYDVTESKMWKNGQHMKKHFAGRDLTEELKDAPHGESVFENFKFVCNLESSDKIAVEDPKEKLRELYRKFHPHPMFIHFPVALFNFAVLMQISYLITGKPAYENAGFYALIVGTLSIIPAALSGFASWYINYNCVLNRIFKIKIVFTLFLVISASAAVVLRFSSPELSDSTSLQHNIYTFLVILNLPITGAIGFNGGKLTWG